MQCNAGGERDIKGETNKDGVEGRKEACAMKRALA